MTPDPDHPIHTPPNPPDPHNPPAPNPNFAVPPQNAPLKDYLHRAYGAMSGLTGESLDDVVASLNTDTGKDALLSSASQMLINIAGIDPDRDYITNTHRIFLKKLLGQE